MNDHKAKIIKGRVIIALHEVLGRRPTNVEIDAYYRALYATFAPAMYEHQRQKQQ